MYDLLAENRRRCLWCFKELDKGNIVETFFQNDCLCQECRRKMEYKNINIKLDKLDIEALYPYKDEGRRMLLQYKEYMDEALYPLFLKKNEKYLRKKYKDYILVPIPSSIEALEKRGFNHVEKMFSLMDKEYDELLENTGMYQQKSLSVTEREERHIQLKKYKIVKRRKYLLVDDLITTGNTMLQGYESLKRFGEVKGLCVFYNVRWNKKDNP